jgi:hypothetical protein
MEWYEPRLRLFKDVPEAALSARVMVAVQKLSPDAQRLLKSLDEIIRGKLNQKLDSYVLHRSTAAKILKSGLIGDDILPSLRGAADELMTMILRFGGAGDDFRLPGTDFFICRVFDMTYYHAQEETLHFEVNPYARELFLKGCFREAIAKLDLTRLN